MNIRKINYNGRIYEFESYQDRDKLDREWIKRKTFYEYKLLDTVKKMNLTGVYIDLGSNVGNHSIFFATQCKATKVICVDASSELCEVLKKNWDRNVKNEVALEIYNNAITNSSGLVTMTPLHETTCEINKKGSGNVYAKTIDELFGDLRGVVLLKMDIEGYEIEAIRGAKNFIENNYPVIVAELLDATYFRWFKKEVSKFGYVTNGKNYASTPTYFWIKR